MRQIYTVTVVAKIANFCESLLLLENSKEDRSEVVRMSDPTIFYPKSSVKGEAPWLPLLGELDRSVEIGQLEDNLPHNRNGTCVAGEYCLWIVEIRVGWVYKRFVAGTDRIESNHVIDTQA